MGELLNRKRIRFKTAGASPTGAARALSYRRLGVEIGCHLPSKTRTNSRHQNQFLNPTNQPKMHLRALLTLVMASSALAAPQTTTCTSDLAETTAKPNDTQGYCCLGDCSKCTPNQCMFDYTCVNLPPDVIGPVRSFLFIFFPSLCVPLR